MTAYDAHRIRPATPADLDALVGMEARFPTDRLSRRAFRHLLTRANASVLACTAGTGLHGNIVILYRKNSTIARLYSLVVDPAHQGRGLARALLDAAETDARRHACTRICLEVRPDNDKALRLYEHRGYAVTGHLAHYYEDNSPALRLCKALG